VIGREVCKLHGGLAPAPAMREGRFSQLPSRLKALYERGLADATLLDHRPVLSIMNALIEDLGARMAESDTNELRARALALCADAELALTTGDAAQGVAALRKARALLQTGLDSDEDSRQLFTWSERFAIRIDEAWRLRLQRQQAMAGVDVIGMLTMLLNRARTRWTEQQARELAEMFESLLGDTSAAPGRGEIVLAAIPPEGQTGSGGSTNGNTAS
jgi:hypothetical protein